MRGDKQDHEEVEYERMKRRQRSIEIKHHLFVSLLASHDIRENSGMNSYIREQLHSCKQNIHT